MKRNTKTNNKPTHKLPKNDWQLEKIPENLLATISGGLRNYASVEECIIWEIEEGGVR
ncbi:hypothetical protein [Moorena sp. SIO4G3]|uniref:hypothetical protein n=1 Tax=Moorena sp. SIO4G3 TaxID=2607821 RepID=UPI00142AEA29|nr:hypothetical protein [Moorena sp. SIO4G3]NEO76150.1 hypothetical protein [Moorena sp. SIO4G3]